METRASAREGSAPAQHGPHRGLLGARAPQRHARDAQPAQQRQGVGERGRVEGPHLVGRPPRVAVVEAQALGVGHEEGRGAHARGEGEGLDGAQRAPLSPAGPVVGVGAEGDHEALPGHGGEGAAHGPLDPRAGGDGAWRAVRVVLVVGHEHHAVAHRGEAREVVGAVAEGHVHGDAQAPGVQALPQRGDEGDEARAVFGREGLEVDVESLGAQGDGARGEALGGAGSGDRVGEEGRGLGGGPAVAVEVGDARVQVHRGVRRGDAGDVVDLFAHVAARAREAEPVGRDHRDARGVGAQRGVRRRRVHREHHPRPVGQGQRGAPHRPRDPLGLGVERAEVSGVRRGERRDGLRPRGGRAPGERGVGSDTPAPPGRGVRRGAGLCPRAKSPTVSTQSATIARATRNTTRRRRREGSSKTIRGGSSAPSRIRRPAEERLWREKMERRREGRYALTAEG